METSKKLMLIELNEFSTDLFRKAVKEIKLPNIERLLEMKESTTITDDQIEHRGLDPWVQWVSVHTGVPSSDHGVIHLGDAPSRLGFKQIWEKLSDLGVTSGVWGAMNASRGDAKNCKFFLPDPWTFSEVAYPQKINDLLALPRYYSKNYLDVSKWTFFKALLRLVKYVTSSGVSFRLVRMAPMILKQISRYGINNATLFSLFDLFSTILFLQQKKKEKPDFSLIFLNSIAHLQHHKWENAKALQHDVAFGMTVIDRVLGMLFASRTSDEALIIMNALTQRNISQEKPRICYRQISPSNFLKAVGLDFERVEQLMTNDAHVFFKNQAARDHAEAVLSKTFLQNVPLFHVESNSQNKNKLFYQVDFWDEINSDEKFSINGREVLFSDFFEAIVARTGAHIPNGNVFYDGLQVEGEIYNHDINARILSIFSAKSKLARN